MARAKDHVSLNGTPKAGKRITVQASHVVSFRLSDTKYRQLARMSDICEESTPSELAREMVCNVLNGPQDEKQLSLFLVMQRLAKEVTELQQRVTRLFSLLEN